MINNYQDFVSYIGAGNLAVYSFPFKIKSADQILIMAFDTLDDSEIFVEKGDIGINVQSVTFDSILGGGTITLPANLAVGYKLIIKLGIDAPTQDFQLREQEDFKLRQLENALDFCVTSIQRLFEKSARALSFDENASYVTGLNTKIAPLPIPDGIPVMDPTGTFLEMKTAADIFGGSGAGLPPGGTEGQVLTVGPLPTQTPGWNSYAYNGFSARFGSLFSSISLDDTLLQILNLTYTPPSVSLSGTGSGTIREKGQVVASASLSANITRNSDPIDRIRFFRGVTLLYDENPALNPNSQVAPYVDATPFSDNVSYTSVVTDDGTTGGPTNVTSNTVTYQFVYPYYYGADVAGLTPAQVGTLTKDIIVSTATVNETIAALNGEVFYFAYPAAYPALTSILDVSNFETIADWTVSIGNITGLDATPQSYRIYEFNNPVVAGSYFYSFRR